MTWPDLVVSARAWSGTQPSFSLNAKPGGSPLDRICIGREGKHRARIRPHKPVMAAIRAGCWVPALLLLAAVSAQAEFFEDFSSTWTSRWTHSAESKYNGRFQVETPEGLDQPALKVREQPDDFSSAAIPAQQIITCISHV